MSISFAVAGKGGVGKTTICALIIRSLIDKGKIPVLALDADANSNLNELLGLSVNKTVGALREEFRANAQKLDAGVHKDELVEMNVNQSLIESKNFDLLVMGRGEGPGCYCYANTLFRKYIDILQASYKYLVMDNEAGMEHLSRRTTQDISVLFIVSDSSPRGIEAAARIRDLAIELKLKIKEIFLIINRVKGEVDKRTKDITDLKGFKAYYELPEDDDIKEMDLGGNDIFALPESSLSLEKISSIISQFII
ncbi:MAG: ATP-binding protein [Candidatus Humimicrobiaceae bacterium]